MIVIPDFFVPLHQKPTDSPRVKPNKTNDYGKEKDKHRESFTECYRSRN